MEKKEILSYARKVGASKETIKWVTRNFSFCQNQQEAEHIIDYMLDKTPKTKTMSYKQAKNNCEKWHRAQIKKGNHIREKSADTELVLDFKDGFTFRKLIGVNAYKREGFLMHHCVASYFGKNDSVYSLRDKNNMPHCTISRDSRQIKGKGNGSISPKYIKYVVKGLEYLNIPVHNSEMKNLGYINISKIKDNNAVFTPLFKNVWAFMVSLRGLSGHGLSWQSMMSDRIWSALKRLWWMVVA